MADTAAHLVDRVFPRVPVRQWVLSLPFALRYKLAYDAELITAVLGVFARAVFAFLRKMGRDYGVHETQCGAVTFIQRYGGALNLNPHFHVLAIDGVYAPDAEGNPKFYELRQPTDAEIAGLTETVAIRIGELVQSRALETAGSGEEETDRLFREQPWLSKLYASSVSNRTATGPNAGQRTLRTGDRLDPEALETLASGPVRCAPASPDSICMPPSWRRPAIANVWRNSANTRPGPRSRRTGWRSCRTDACPTASRPRGATGRHTACSPSWNSSKSWPL
jgi:hypothetical protein